MKDVSGACFHGGGGQVSDRPAMLLSGHSELLFPVGSHAPIWQQMWLLQEKYNELDTSLVRISAVKRQQCMSM